MSNILNLVPVDANTDIKLNRNNVEEYDGLQIVGFKNLYYFTINFTSAIQMYGFVMVETSKGKAYVYLNGYDDISTNLDSGIEFYKHKKSDTELDIQVIVSSKYAHGFMIVGGSASAGTIEIFK